MATRVLAAALIAASLGASAFAVGFMGPPTAELNAGQWNIGYSYSYSRQDLDRATAKGTWYYAEFDGGVLVYDDGDTLEPRRVTAEDVTTQRNQMVLGYGVMDQWEVYGTIGVADIKSSVKERWWDGMGYDTDKYSFNFDNDLAWGLGTRVTVAQQDNVKWGVSAQMNWIDTSIGDKYSGAFPLEEEWVGVWSERWRTEVEAVELLIAFGATVDMAGWKLYGGPYYYHLSGDMKTTYTYTADNQDGWVEVSREKYKSDAEASRFGGFVGAIFDLTENSKLTTEFNMHGDGWGSGASIMFTF
ncbi:MAG TPA: hypothetical protein VLH60_00250 [Sedimentisphaerales bacterium]|nr:hypothetical protein [Sedimentisphaerales bacterium]